MKQEQDVQGATFATLERMKSAYAQQLQSAPLSLQELLEPEHFRFDAYCAGFTPHPEAEALKEVAEAFGQQYGTWLANSKYYISVAWYLYPTAHFNRLFSIIKNLSIGFYLNDVMGRDVFKFLTPEQQQVSRKLINNMASLDEDLVLSPTAHPLELANAEMLKELKDNSPEAWFSNFLRVYSHHLSITHRDRNADTLGHIPDIYEYMDNRCHYAAVYHLVLWIEYSNGEFLDWALLEKTGIAQRLKRLHWVTAAFPALANDLFSFEGEVIDNDCDANLMMIIALNNPELGLREVIDQAAGVVRNLIVEILALKESIAQEARRNQLVYPDLSRTLDIHLTGIERFVQASWLWQVYTKRYKRPQSIWLETSQAVREVAIAV